MRRQIYSGLIVASFIFAGCGADTPKVDIRGTDVPASSGAMGSNLVPDGSGGAILSWIEPGADGHVLRFSRYSGAEWSAAHTVASGDNWFVNWADFPSVVALSEDRWAAHWLRSQPEGGYAYDVLVSVSQDAGQTWSEPFLSHSDGTPTEHGFVTLYPDDGNLGIVWLDGRKMVNEYDENDISSTGMTLRGGTFGFNSDAAQESIIDDLVCDCCQTDVALTPGGPAVIYRNRTVDEIRDIYVARRANGEWQPGVAVSNDDWNISACPVNGPIIRGQGSNVAAAWFTAAGDRPVVKVAWSTDNARSFGDPVEVASDLPAGYVAADMGADGALYVAWQRKIGDGKSELVLRRIEADGTMSGPATVQQARDIYAFSVPQIVALGDELLLVWTSRKNDEYALGSAIVPMALL